MPGKGRRQRQHGGQSILEAIARPAGDVLGNLRFANRGQAIRKDKGHENPFDPGFAGRSILLIDDHTRSAGELLADGYKNSKLGTLIGTPTAGAVMGGATYVCPATYCSTWPCRRWKSRANHLKAKASRRTKGSKGCCLCERGRPNIRSRNHQAGRPGQVAQAAPPPAGSASQIAVRLDASCARAS